MGDAVLGSVTAFPAVVGCRTCGARCRAGQRGDAQVWMEQHGAVHERHGEPVGFAVMATPRPPLVFEGGAGVVCPYRGCGEPTDALGRCPWDHSDDEAEAEASSE